MATFEAILSNQRAKAGPWRRATLLISVVLHVGALLAGIAQSVWQVEEMPMPSLEVTLTAAPPPPPPPPPPAAKKASDNRPKTRPIEPRREELVVPKETPKQEAQPEPQEAEENGQENGQPGGVSGGVAGGVLGGVVGAPPPPPPKPTGPKMVSAKIARGQLLIDPNSDPYRVKLPQALARSGETYVAMMRVCVSAQGSVTAVQVMKGAGPAIDTQLPSVIGRWRYRPLLSDGVPTPFCYPLRYEVSGR